MGLKQTNLTMSFDFLEDACDSLDKSEMAYLIVVFVPESDDVRVASNLCSNAALVRKMVESGKFAERLVEHLDAGYSEL